MYIKSIILDGFKSYGQRTEINGFDCEFNAITGLNGSGKSNILDAICFVLGISNLSQVRAGQLQDLVYKNGQAGVTKATVTITFDNRDRDQKPPGFDDYEEITVARQVIIGGKNKYMINGSAVQNKRVQDLFCSVQLNVNNPHFLIMQGRITKVLNMKPPEILSMIEEAAGTRMYETKKQSAHKTIEKKNAKLRELDGVISEEIKPKLQKLEHEREQYLQYQKIERELEHYNNMWIAYQRISIVKNSAKSREDLQTMENKMVAKNQTIENKEQEIKSIENDIVELNQLKDKESGGILHKLEADLKSKEHVEANASAKLKSTKESITTEKKKIKQLEKTLQEDQTAYETKKSELDKVNGMFTKLRDKDTEDANALKLAQKRFEAVSVGMVLGEDGEAATLQEQLIVAKQEEVEAGTRIKQSEMQLQRSTEQLKIKESELKNTSGNLNNDKRNLALMEKEVNQFEQQIASIEETAQQATQVMDRRRFVSNRVRELRHQTEQFERRFPHTVFMYQDPEPNFNRKRVHGVACKLFTLKDRMWATACETIAGGRLYSVIIDTDVTGKLLLQRGNLRQRTTFIPLNKIQPYVIDQKTIETAQRLVGPDNVKCALSLIDYPPTLHKAMAYIFGGTFVCRDMAVAKKVAFDKRIMRRCITLDGDTVDPAGTLSGGARGEAGSLLTTLDGVKDTINELARLEQELADLQQQERQTAATKEKYDTLQQQLVVQKHKLETTRQRLQETTHYQKQAEIEELKKNIAELKQIIIESKNKQTESKKKIKDLESQISNQHGHKDRLLKEAQNEMDRLKKQADASQKQWKQKEQQFETLNLELSELQKTLENVREQLVNGEKTVKELEEQMVTLQENFDKAKKEVAQVASTVKEAKHEIASHTTEIQQKIKKKDKLMQDIADIKLELQKMEHDLTKLKAEVNDSKQREKELIKKYDWLGKDNEYTTKAAKLTDKEANELGHHTANLKATQKKLGRNVNTRVMSLLNDEEKQYTDMLKRKDKIENDKKSILKMIQSLDRKKEQAILIAWEQVNKDFGSIFGMLLPGANAKLKPIDGKSVLEGLEVKVSFGGVWKESLGELSGGQRSLVALSLILAMLLFKPAPIYILDEVDAALDLSHTQNIGNMLRTHFKHSQFVIVSLKDGMFNNANVLFRTKFVDGMSVVTRTWCKK